MPYSVPSPVSPAPAPLPIHSQGRPGHRRSYSYSFTNERGPGAFAPLGALPRRRASQSQGQQSQPPTPAPTPPTPGKSKFHIEDDEEDEESSSGEGEGVEDGEREREREASTVRKLELPPAGPPALKLKPNHNFGLVINTHPELDEDARPPSPPGASQVPFPSIHVHVQSPTPLPVPFPSSGVDSPVHSPRPSMSRTSSTPIFLSNGKPLKSSLKSSSSSPHIPFPTQSLVPSLYAHQHQAHHLRARSAPSTPHLGSLSPPSPSPSPSSSGTSTPPTKNVHFPSQEEGGLETVRLFSRSAKPASLSRPAGEETETETEGEGSGTGYIRAGGGMGGGGYPFPRFAGGATAVGRKVPSPLGAGVGKQAGPGKQYALDETRTSSVPMRSPPPYANVYLESLVFASPAASTSSAPAPALTGTLLVRNLAYEKHVFVRFTLDEWHTTSEVAGKHVVSLPCLPAPFAFSPSTTVGDLALPTPNSSGTPGEWDRFGFTINLADYPSLPSRTLWLVVRFATPAVAVGGGEGEWWDNNAGGNYRVGFREVEGGEDGGKEVGRAMGAIGRRTAVSAPSVFPGHTTPLQPATTAVSSNENTPSSNARPTSPGQSPPSVFAQTTLSRLKKLNLRNYAAPSSSPMSPTSSSPASTSAAGVLFAAPSSSIPSSLSALSAAPSTSSSSAPPPPTSAPSAEGGGSAHTTPHTSPLHTPTDGTPMGSLMGLMGMGMGMEGGFPSTSSPAGSVLGGYLTSSPAGSFVSSSSVDAAGARGAFSPLGAGGGSPVGVPASGSVEGNGVYWPWGSSNSPSSPSTNIPGTEDTDAPTGVPPSLLEGIKEKSTSSPPRSPIRSRADEDSSSGGSSTGSGSKLHARRLMSSAKSGSNSNSGSGSGSGSNSSPLRQSLPLPSLGLFEQGKRSARRTPTPRSSPVSSSPSGSGGEGDLAPASRHAREPADEMKDPDAIYQAFVRQWCFAQGPAPAVGAAGGPGVVVG